MKTTFLTAYNPDDEEYAFADSALEFHFCREVIDELFELPAPRPARLAFVLSSDPVDDAYRITPQRTNAPGWKLLTGAIEVHHEEANNDVFFIGTGAARWVNLHVGPDSYAYGWVQF